MCSDNLLCYAMLCYYVLPLSPNADARQIPQAIIIVWPDIFASVVAPSHAMRHIKTLFSTKTYSI